MVKDQNTYAKRDRETAKKRKADAKRERRRRKKEQTSQLTEAAGADTTDVDTDNAEHEDIRAVDRPARLGTLR